MSHDKKKDERLEEMNKQQLASLVWDTCDDLRGSISAVEYKDIILGFIFYRFVF